MAASRKGKLVIIGGGEDREGDKVVLRRVVELAGGARARIVVLTTASKLAAADPAEAAAFAKLYETAFADAGAAEVRTLAIFDRQAANDPEHVKAVKQATAVFMTGGAQARLTSILGGTGVDVAMHDGYQQRGVVIAGTSAGASALSHLMVLGGPSDKRPTKGALPLAPGLGFLGEVLIDQHFNERQRLARLMSVIAINPSVAGLGIDEDTALVLLPGHGLEVVGSGAVTLVDGCEMAYTTYNEIDEGEVLTLTDVRLHLLPAGFRYDREDLKPGSEACKRTSPAFQSLVDRLLAAC